MLRHREQSRSWMGYAIGGLGVLGASWAGYSALNHGLKSTGPQDVRDFLALSATRVPIARHIQLESHESDLSHTSGPRTDFRTWMYEQAMGDTVFAKEYRRCANMQGDSQTPPNYEIVHRMRARRRLLTLHLASPDAAQELAKKWADEFKNRPSQNESSTTTNGDPFEEVTSAIRYELAHSSPEQQRLIVRAQRGEIVDDWKTVQRRLSTNRLVDLGYSRPVASSIAHFVGRFDVKEALESLNREGTACDDFASAVADLCDDVQGTMEVDKPIGRLDFVYAKYWLDPRLKEGKGRYDALGHLTPWKVAEFLSSSESQYQLIDAAIDAVKKDQTVPTALDALVSDIHDGKDAQKLRQDALTFLNPQPLQKAEPHVPGEEEETAVSFSPAGPEAHAEEDPLQAALPLFFGARRDLRRLVAELRHVATVGARDLPPVFVRYLSSVAADLPAEDLEDAVYVAFRSRMTALGRDEKAVVLRRLGSVVDSLGSLPHSSRVAINALRRNMAAEMSVDLDAEDAPETSINRENPKQSDPRGNDWARRAARAA